MHQRPPGEHLLLGADGRSVPSGPRCASPIRSLKLGQSELVQTILSGTRVVWAFCQDIFHWYNAEHHHSGIGLLPPEVVHYGQALAAYDARAQVLAAAHAALPERFVRQAPRPPQLPAAAWINPPKPVTDAPTTSEDTPQ